MPRAASAVCTPSGITSAFGGLTVKRCWNASEIGLPKGLGGLRFSLDGTRLYAIGNIDSNQSKIYELPVTRGAGNEVTIVGSAVANHSSTSPSNFAGYDAGLEFGPAGSPLANTLFDTYLGVDNNDDPVTLLGEWPSGFAGSETKLDTGGIVNQSLAGVTFPPVRFDGGTNVYRLHASLLLGAVEEIDLAPSATPGLFTPTAGRLFTVVIPTNIGSIQYVPGGSFVGDLLYASFDDVSVRRLEIDPATGFPINKNTNMPPASLPETNPKDDVVLSGFSPGPIGLEIDPGTNDDLFVSTFDDAGGPNVGKIYQIGGFNGGVTTTTTTAAPPTTTSTTTTTTTTIATTTTTVPTTTTTIATTTTTAAPTTTTTTVTTTSTTEPTTTTTQATTTTTSAPDTTTTTQATTTTTGGPTTSTSSTTTSFTLPTLFTTSTTSTTATTSTTVPTSTTTQPPTTTTSTTVTTTTVTTTTQPVTTSTSTVTTIPGTTSTSTTQVATTSTTATTQPATTSTTTSAPGSTTTSSTSSSTTTATGVTTSSTLPLPTTTTSVTPTTTRPSTTTTTLFTCADDVSFASIECRLHLLVRAVDGATDLGGLATGLRKKAGRAEDKTLEAEAKLLAGHLKGGRTALAGAARALAGFRNRLASRAARRTIPEATRTALGNSAKAILDDLRALLSGAT